MFRRRAQRLLRRMTTPNIPALLQQANQLMASGDYANAAEAFKKLAQRAEDQFPHRAPFLFMEAGRAAILSGQIKIGVAHLRSGLTLFASQGRFKRMMIFGQRAVEELGSRNLNVEAEEIENLLKGNLPKEIQNEGPPITKRPILPTHCPSCGAAVRPNEVEWLDDVTAECDYCGSPIRGDST